MPGSPGTPSYVANPFAAAPGAQSAAYASALRNYTPNAFAGQATPGSTAMAPHLSQPIPLDQDILQAYRDVRSNPMASQYEQSVPDIGQLWRTSPGSSIFKPGYSHNPYVTQKAEELRGQRALGAMTPEERQRHEMQAAWYSQTFSGGGD